jgi:mono/diheme cytochrome c family protein
MKKLLVILFILLTGCSLRIAPPAESEMKTLSGEVLKGKKVFMDNCSRCHPNGRGGLGPSIFDKPLPGFLIRFQVRNGLGTMPHFDKEHLTDEDLVNLITYIKEN